MRWEVQYPEPKAPAPFDNYDLIVCLGFAYGYTASAEMVAENYALGSAISRT